MGENGKQPFPTVVQPVSVSPGMERCLKKLVLEAETTGFPASWKAVGSWWDHLGEEIVLSGPGWNQTGVYYQPPRGQQTNSGLILTGR